jgi:hypothetical protein
VRAKGRKSADLQPIARLQSGTKSMEAASYPSRTTLFAVSCDSDGFAYIQRCGYITPDSSVHRLSVKLTAINDRDAYYIPSSRAARSAFNASPVAPFRGGDPNELRQRRSYGMTHGALETCATPQLAPYACASSLESIETGYVCCVYCV